MYETVGTPSSASNKLYNGSNYLRQKEKEWQEECLKKERDEPEMHLREEQTLMEKKRQKHELEQLKCQQELKQLDTKMSERVEAARHEDE